MKKNYFAMMLLAMSTLSAQAQYEDWTSYDFQDQMFIDDYGDDFPEEYPPIGLFQHVSANGKYAVGYDNEQLFSNTGGAFVWKLEDSEVLHQLGHLQDRVSACDVSNDGIVVGSFERRDDIDTKAVCYPGWLNLKDGEWTRLDVPENFSLYQARTSAFTQEARAITPDASVIAGNIHLKIGEKDVLGTVTDVVISVPIVWEKSGDGYAIKACYSELGQPGKSMLLVDGELKTVESEVNSKTFLVNDISNDGSIIVGMNVSWCGGFNPAFIRDGKLVQLFSCGEEGDDNDEANFNGGIITTIDANNNMYGYYMEADGNTITLFRYTAEGKMEYFEQPVICADKNGNTFGPYTAGLSPVMDCSEDGYVLVGGAVGVAGYGAYQLPKLAFDGVHADINAVRSNPEKVKIEYTNGRFDIKGNYYYANVYDTNGRIVASGKRGTIFDLSAQPVGTYIVKVAGATGVQTLKVIR